MKRNFYMQMLAALVFAITGAATSAQDSPAKTPAADGKPIKALLVTGGCCHDYDRQKLIITKGVSARANVVWTVAHQGGTATNSKIPLYTNPNWADGFDVIVHNECFSDAKEKEWLDGILKPHRAGTPAVLIHCAMHCYRTGTDDWFEFVGMQSPGHGPHHSYTVQNINDKHPIMADFGKQWVAPKGELYYSVKVFDTATPLGQANRQSDNQPQTCIWTNLYNKKTRVFGTTIGHYNETMVEPTYLDMLTRGLLWATDRLDENAIKPTTAAIDDEIRALATIELKKEGPAPNAGGKCCGEGNLVNGKKATASSEETSKNNFARHAIDGQLGTRWCASGGNQTGEWWQVDLDQPQHVKSLRIHWEKGDQVYRYTVEASADAKAWKTIVDQSKNEKVGQITPHTVDSPNTQFLRVNYLGSKSGVWSSFWEFEAYKEDMPPELPKSVRQATGALSASVADVEVPSGFNVTMFGSPPDVNYPVCLTAAATGEVFVGVDEQGSLGKESGKGRVIRCVDVDGDGKADKINTFATMDHPRGLIYDNGSLWVLHPPFLSVYHDDNRDGTADRHEVLITGISTDEVNKRGADHTTNGIRMGIDGWIYIAVGDFGFVEAKGTDGRVLSRRGGGILRVRLDGSDMEIHNWGQRNILDACIDPYMNIFTRDNTNDGGGWDIRVTHVLQSAEYGYPSLFLNFTDESMPALAEYGGGSGCGGMFLHDLRWPTPFANAAYTCDWGRSEVYIHNLPAHGPTFDAHQDVFMKIPRPTDIDIDGSGRMYVSSWKNGQFAYGGPNVGFVVQVTPIDFKPNPFPDLNKATDEQLIGFLASPSAVYRQHSQLEILRRGANNARIDALTKTAGDANIPLYGRVAAIFTLKQLAGADSTDALVTLAKQADIREFALRALTDRSSELKDVPTEPFVAALADSNPRVQAQALICLGRLGRQETAAAIVPLTTRATQYPVPTKEPLFNQPDPGRVIPHLAVRALVAVDGAAACLKAIGTEHSAGSLWALKYMHNETAVKGLIGLLSTERDTARRLEVLTTLIRLYHLEGEYKGGWWGTRPDRTGPYYDRQTWSQSETIAKALTTAVAEADKSTVAHAAAQLDRHKVAVAGLPSIAQAEARAQPEKPIVVPTVDPNNPDQVANLKSEVASQRAFKTDGDVEKGRALFTQQSCIACHTVANGQSPKGPHLVDIGKRYKKDELIESILNPSAKIAQGFDTYSFIMNDGKIFTGFVTSESAADLQIKQTDGVTSTIKAADIDERVKQKLSMMPIGLANNLTPEQVADLVAYLQSLK